MRLDPGQIEVVDEQMAEVYRRMTGAERLHVADTIFRSVRRMLLHHLRSQHPDWSEARITREAARRISHGAI